MDSEHQQSLPVWARPWVGVGLFGAGLVGLVIPLASHAVSYPEHFGAGHLWAHFLLPHSILMAIGTLIGGGLALSGRQAARSTSRARYIWWSGVFVFGLCIALFGWAERVIRQSAYDLSAIDVKANLWLLVLRVSIGSLAGWFAGAYLWRRRGRTAELGA